MSCFTGETSVPGIEPEICSPSFGHNTKALSFPFGPTVLGGTEPPGAGKTLKKHSLVLAGIRTRAT